MRYLEEDIDVDEEDTDVHWESVQVDLDGYLRMGDPSFKRHYRLTKTTYEALLLVIANHFVDSGRLQRVRTKLDIVLLMVLWILANPDTFRSVALRFGYKPGSVHYHYCYIIEALRELAPRYIYWPDQAERQVIKDAFEAYSGFYGIVGCLDGTYNVIIAPVGEKRHFRNRHHQYSFNTQVVCDHNLMIRDVCLGEVGSLHDARVFRPVAVPSLIV